ncbi:MAG TPA: adenylosuccinate lyase [Myxococcota bacterium]|nr:adenylosuccinate lyase [Myxococcota bacterium]
MISRYTRPEMGRLWSDRERFSIWMEVELCACEAMAAEGLVPSEVAHKLRAAQWEINDSDVAEIAKIEAETRHDVIAFLTHLERRMGPEARYLHLGMTSSDVLDTGLAIQLSRAMDAILNGLDALRQAVGVQARRHRRTVMVGRSHGIHAEPITFGLTLLVWYAELGRQRRRLEAARDSVATGKVSGAVGTFAHLPPAVEESVCKSLGLKNAPVSNQIVQRDRHAEMFCALANLGATLEKMAVNIRHLQRTEVAEVMEPFKKGQRGSSAMPHKKNPIGCENLTGVARLLRSYASAALENVALWHERDISHSSVERVIGPDATILCDYALARMTRIIEGLVVNADRMRHNLAMTGGLVFSQSVLLALVKAGMQREKAYTLVQRAALESWDTGENLKSLLERDREVVKSLGRDGVDNCFDPDLLLARTEIIFKRVLEDD